MNNLHEGQLKKDVVIELVRECPCGEIFTTTTETINDYGEMWCEKYGFCTQNCMEYFLDYDEFKDSIRDNNGRVDFNSSGVKWKEWVENKIKVYVGHMPLDDLFEIQAGIMQSVGQIQALMDLGVSFEEAEDIAWSDKSDRLVIKDGKWWLRESSIKKQEAIEDKAKNGQH